jgi:hypothetical protein
MQARDSRVVSKPARIPVPTRVREAGDCMSASAPVFQRAILPWELQPPAVSRSVSPDCAGLRLTRQRAPIIIPQVIRELNMKTEKKEDRQHQPVEKYEQPEVVNMGKVVDLTHGNTGSSTDTNAQTIPVQK